MIPSLESCRYCKWTKSTTAWLCPSCGKSDHTSVNVKNALARFSKIASLAALAVAGPAAVFGAIYGREMHRPSQKKVREIARSNCVIDLVPFGQDNAIFFTQDSFFILFLYDMGLQSGEIELIPFSLVKKVLILEWEPKRVLGMFMTGLSSDSTFRETPPRRPKPLERILLGKQLYNDLIKAADDFDKGIVTSEPTGPGFSFAGRDSQERSAFLIAKFKEYVPVEVEQYPGEL